MDSSRSDSNNDDPLPDLKLGALFKNHWTDWIFIIILIILWGVCHIVTPFQRYVGAQNFATQSIIYPYKDNTIPFQIMPVCDLVDSLSLLAVCVAVWTSLRRHAVVPDRWLLFVHSQILRGRFLSIPLDSCIPNGKEKKKKKQTHGMTSQLTLFGNDVF